MYYRDLIQFEPIETVIQLTSADEHAEALDLTKNYVISERMAEQLSNTIFEQLRFDKIVDNKGLLIVGNYGTGKSHLMSVVTSIAQYSDALDYVSQPVVREKAALVCGKFKVIRNEIGSTTMCLRDIICSFITNGLSKIGVEYEFPLLSEVANNKDALVGMMAAFHEQYPEQGLLLAVDELLDYLSSRKEHDLILDLGFLREIGEVCQTTNFRFMAGLQEMLFDNPRFQFVADRLRRVRDRFEQVRIVREDVAYVVAERLLKKDANQKAMIHQHLLQFAPMYSNMNERIDQYITLFPVHPAYLETFEKVYVAEKREILKTLSTEIKKLLDKEVPTDQTGLIAYDSYWPYLEANTTLRTDPSVRAVIDKSKIVQDRILHGFTRPTYRPLALRIMQALSVHRLTTGDVYAQVGVTAVELRDDLCLYLPLLPEKTAEFLESTIRTTLKEILRTLNFQFVSFNNDNDQYYLDLKKDIAYDNLVEEKAEAMDDSELDRHYFAALGRLLDCENSYVPSFKIWEHEITWREHMITRQGYLFFGTSNERPTAEPLRDFWIYFLPIFAKNINRGIKENKADEVFFRLAAKDENFLKNLKFYAAANELALNASGVSKQTFENIAAGYIKLLNSWLKDNIGSAYEVIYKGTSRRLGERVQGILPAHASVREMMTIAAGTCLAAFFTDVCPRYPIFKGITMPITSQSMPGFVLDGVKYVAGIKTKNGAVVLNGLGLLKDDRVDTTKSQYVTWLKDLFAQKGQGKVINRGDLLEEYPHGIAYTKDDKGFRLEPEWLVVVITAMIMDQGFIITIGAKNYGPTNLDELIRIPVEDMKSFSHLAPPKDLPMEALQELCEFLGVPKGLMASSTNHDEAVRQFAVKRTEIIQRVLLVKERLNQGISLWGIAIYDQVQAEQAKTSLEALKQFLEGLAVYNSPAKLKNFRYSVADIVEQKDNVAVLAGVELMLQRLAEVEKTATYLAIAAQVLPSEHAWQANFSAIRDTVVFNVRQGRNMQDMQNELLELKGKFIETYMELHGKAKISVQDNNKKISLLSDKRFVILYKLSEIEMLFNRSLVTDMEDKLKRLKSCGQLVPPDLAAQPVCPHCNFRPIEEASVTVAPGIITSLDEGLSQQIELWTEKIQEALSDTSVAANIALLAKDEQILLTGFRDVGELPYPLNQAFIEAVRTVLMGIDKMPISLTKMYKALGAGLPMTVAEFRQRFDEMLKEMSKNKDISKVRILIEK